MNMQLVNEITKSQIKTDVPQFKAGDTLKVFVKIQEGNKTRLQMFEGVCIAKKGCGIGETFTVRKISYGVGVERVFPVNSPSVTQAPTGWGLPWFAPWKSLPPVTMRSCFLQSSAHSAISSGLLRG